MTDFHICPFVTPVVPPIPHIGGPIITGCFTVLIGGLPAARVTDMCVCVGPPDIIILGEFTVLIGGLPAARMLDMTAHGGMIVFGSFTVLIGAAGGGGAASGPAAIAANLIAGASGPAGMEIAVNTAKAILTGKINIVDLNSLPAATPAELAASGIDTTKHPAGTRYLKYGGEIIPTEPGVDGWQQDAHTIIVDGSRNQQDINRIIVHETNHALNGSADNYSTPGDRFREEYRAYYVEAEYAEGPVDRTKAQALKQRVLTDPVYAPTMPGVAANSVPDAPPGNVTNSN